MRTSLLPLSAGVVVGAFLIREARRRDAAERFAGGALESLLKAIDANDADTGLHVRRVAAFARILAEEAGLDDHACRGVERVALFHDIGKIHEALFDIIHEASKLTPAERRAIATHPQRGAEVLAPLSRFYPDLADGVLSHHERWDGTGYPRKLRGKRIPLTARIVTLADTYDVITHGRRYRGSRGAAAAAEIIAAGRGTQFDPELTDLMLLPPVFDRIVAEQRRWLGGPRVAKASRNERRHGSREEFVPDVSFRWRTESPEPLLRDHAPRESR